MADAGPVPGTVSPTPAAAPGADTDPLAGVPVDVAAARQAGEVLTALGSGPSGLDPAEAARRLAAGGPNAVRTHAVRPLRILGRQFRNAVLILLLVTATVSFLLGQRTDTVVIALILLASVGLGFLNEYRAARAGEALHDQVTHTAAVLRGGRPVQLEVTGLVPGDVVRLVLGEVVPADLRLLEAIDLQCDESVLTGESLPVDKSPAPVPPHSALGDLTSCAFMGTVVRAGAGTGVVVATGRRAQFGRVAIGLGERQPDTEFQVGLRRFSVLLLEVAAVLTGLIFVANLMLHRPLIESLLFSLAIAVGITPQLLPAVVSTSLATGSHQLALRKVLVKRLVSIEDLGDMDVLVTDKTGTLTEGRITFTAALDPAGAEAPGVVRLGLQATETDPAGGDAAAAGGNPLDVALWAAAGTPERPWRRIGLLPFDHERRRTSAVVEEPDGTRRLVVKGAPESVLPLCDAVPPEAVSTVQAQFAAGSRVVAVAQRPAPDLPEPAAADERGLSLAGFLVFLDPPKPTAAPSLQRLATLGITVKICTGDNPVVAQEVCRRLGLDAGRALTGADLSAMDDEALAPAARETTVFARVSPEQKARLVTALRAQGHAVGFLGDGVNDALALHSADVGLSVDTATDVAKDAADVILLEKDLAVLADGVSEGRRIFANTIKYVLMGTSSNFGNMFSAAAASAVLPFLPMLPSQILLNNLLYDAGQLTIPTDHVDPEQLHAPSHWDIAQIRRFMLFFGPISSLFDFLTFALMLGVLHAQPGEFRAGWFAESLATQTLVIFAIRTRRSPFTRSRPSTPLLVASLATVAVGALLPLTPLADVLGFAHLPASFYAALAGMVVAYLILIEVAKRVFFAVPEPHVHRPRGRGSRHRVHRRAARFSVGTRLAR